MPRAAARRGLVERVLAGVLLVLSAPLLAVLFLCVWLVDGRPVLHRDERLGLRRKPFGMLKLRTLRREAEHATAQRPVEARDRLEIPGGRLLRATRLDELPQLWNVVRGEMALVGPRPHQLRLYRARREPVPDLDPLLHGRPGLLGPSQLFTPPASPRRIRTWLDRAWVRRRRRAPAEIGLALRVLFAVGRRLAAELVELALDLVRVKLLRRHPRQRRLRRVKPAGAVVVFPARGSRPATHAGLVDINDEAFLIHTRRPMEHGAAFRVRLEIELGRSSGARRIRRARCLAVVVQQRPRGTDHAVVMEYWPLRPLSHYVIQQYFLRNSLVCPRRRAASREDHASVARRLRESVRTRIERLRARHGREPGLHDASADVEHAAEPSASQSARTERTTRPSRGAPAIALAVLGLFALTEHSSTGAQDEPDENAAAATRRGPEIAGVRDARIAPDGTTAVFAAEEPGGTVALFRVPLAGGHGPVRIGGPLVLDGGPRWELTAGGRVVHLGPELASVALADGAVPVRLEREGATTRDFAVAPGGAHVVFRAAPPGLLAGLFAVAVDGSTPAVELVAPSARGEVEHSYRISPDGRSVAFLAHHEDGSRAKLYSAPIEGGPVVLLDDPPTGIQDFRICPDGGRVVYRCEGAAPGDVELRAVPLGGGAPVRLDAAHAGAEIVDFDVGSAGGWVVYLAAGGDGRNTLLGVPADGSAAPVELDRGVTSAYRFHPAGRLVLYAAGSAEDEHLELRAVACDGSGAPFVVGAPPPGHSLGWFDLTPDGTRVVYQVRPLGDGAGRSSELWQVALDELARTRLARIGAGQDFEVDPAGRRVFYREERALYALALEPGSAPVALVSDAAPAPFRVSPDGSRILYRVGDQDEHGVASVLVGGGPPTRLHAPPGTGTGGAPPGTQALGSGGFRDFSFGTSGVAAPTGEKPESKLWWNDGSWWGSLYNDAAQDYHVYRLDAGTQRWIDTGTVLDDRPTTKADVLWDRASRKLYVASHVFATEAVPTPASWGRLYRYSYDPTRRTYAQDPGFPVDITRGSAEALTIAKDSQGRLWATWVEAGRVMVNHSLASDASWRAPFVLPASAAAVTVTPDDVSAIVAFGGNRIGVLWSNQANSTVYFAVHLDGADAAVWQPEEVVLPGTSCTGCADDHINLKADSSGRVFAVLKTSLQMPDEPLNLVAVRGPGGGWTKSVFGLVRDNHTRAILLLDEESQQVHVFATSPTGGGVIYRKSAPLADPRFDPGVGIPFLQSSTDAAINDATSTKQNVDSRSHIVVLASDEDTRFYLHNFLVLGSTQEPPTIGSFSPTSGPVGTNVTITGTRFGGTSSVRFNGIPAAFGVVSSTQIRATVPAGATTGRISVTTPGGTATSAGAFTVTHPPSISSFSPTSGPVGTSVAVTGAGFSRASALRFNGTPAGFTVVSGTLIRTTVPAGATTGRISVTTPDGTATSATDFRVTPAPDIDAFLPPLGIALTPVTITGKFFSGATSVKFNGRSASFTVVNGGLILTAVPVGATTGRISVTTPGGTATSASDFVVIGL